MIVALGTVILILVLTLSITYDYDLQFVREVLPSISRLEPHPVNQSINGFFSRLLTSNKFTNPLSNAPEFAHTVIFITSSGLMIICVILTYLKWLGKTQPQDADFLSTLIIVSVVISPLAWENLYILLVAPLLMLLRYWPAFNRRTRFLLVVAAILINVQRLWDPYVNAPERFPYAAYLGLFMSLAMYGAFVLLVITGFIRTKFVPLQPIP